MVDAQEYLNQKYSQEQRKNITELNLGRKNLTGRLDLNDFPNLEILLCPNNELTEIKVSQCPQLKVIDCWNNKLKELDLTNNQKIEGLVCSDNQLTSLKLANHQNLTYLECSNNYLTNLDSVNNAPLLVDLKCQGNQIEDITNYTFPQLAKERFIWTNQVQEWIDWLYSEQEKGEVKKLNINNRQLGGFLKIEGFVNLEEVDLSWDGFAGPGVSELGVTQCPKLKEINCYWNNLTKLVVNDLESLENLNFSKNQLTDLEIKNCPNLKTLDCSENKLTKLDLSNAKKLEQLNIKGNNFSEPEFNFLLAEIRKNQNLDQQVKSAHYEVVVFILHGLGASMSDSWKNSIEKLQKKLPYNIKFVCPQAPTIQVDLETPWHVPEKKPSWYNIISVEDLRKGINDRGLLISVAEINKLIDQEIEKGIKPENIIIAGESQGGSLALAIGLTSEKKLGGIVSWVGFIAYQNALQGKLTSISKEIPFYLLNSYIDRVVEYGWGAEETREFLQKNGYSFQYKNYSNVGHSHKPMLEDTTNFLKSLLENKNLSLQEHNEQVNIEVVSIKEKEVFETRIEIPPKNN